jgi:hypothetical protein
MFNSGGLSPAEALYCDESAHTEAAARIPIINGAKLPPFFECFSMFVEMLAEFKADPSRFDPVITDRTIPEMTGVERAKIGRLESIRAG